jgi:hypothetical protein
MTINSTRIGPGVLSFGGTAFQAQCRSAVLQVTEVVDSTEKVDVLSGETLAQQDTATYTYALAVTFLQDLGQTALAGIVGYTWANAGQTKAVIYTPNNAAAAGTKTWTMNVRVVPLNVGGDVQAQAAQSDVVMQVIGTPVMS